MRKTLQSLDMSESLQMPLREGKNGGDKKIQKVGTDVYRRNVSP